ncbi:MAG: hypothetical protein ACP5KZ_08180, partial [bacterium]
MKIPTPTGHPSSSSSFARASQREARIFRHCEGFRKEARSNLVFRLTLFVITSPPALQVGVAVLILDCLA